MAPHGVVSHRGLKESRLGDAHASAGPDSATLKWTEFRPEFGHTWDTISRKLGPMSAASLGQR